MKTLREAKVGQTVTVVRLHGAGAVKRRIMDMGITRGTQVHIRKVAPLGDPIELNVRGYELSVRRNAWLDRMFGRENTNGHQNCAGGQPELR